MGNDQQKTGGFDAQVERSEWSPLRQEWMCKRGLEYFQEWLEAGKPTKSE